MGPNVWPNAACPGATTVYRRFRPSVLTRTAQNPPSRALGETRSSTSRCATFSPEVTMWSVHHASPPVERARGSHWPLGLESALRWFGRRRRWPGGQLVAVITDEVGRVPVQVPVSWGAPVGPGRCKTPHRFSLALGSCSSQSVPGIARKGDRPMVLAERASLRRGVGAVWGYLTW